MILVGADPQATSCAPTWRPMVPWKPPRRPPAPRTWPEYYQCRACGELGHNRRSCPTVPRAQRNQVNRCGVCGELGHTARARRHRQ